MSTGTAKQTSSGSENTLQLQLIPYTCIVCGSLSDLFLGPDGKRVEVKQEVIDNGDEQLHDESGDDIELFHFFLRAVCSLKLMAKKWNFESEPVPLCSNCKDKLCRLRSIDAELKRLELRMKDGVNDFKEKMKLCEENFQREEVYQRDERYHKVRSRVIGTKFTKNRPRKSDEAKLVKKQEPEEDRNVRKSSRLRKIEGDATTVEEEVMEMEDTSFRGQEENFKCPLDYLNEAAGSPNPSNSSMPEFTEDNDYMSDSAADTSRPRRAAAKRAKTVISDVVGLGDDDEFIVKKDPTLQSSKNTKKVRPYVEKDEEESSGSEWEEDKRPPVKRRIDSTRTRIEKDVRDKTKRFRSCRTDEQTGKMRYLHVLMDAVDGGQWKCQECGLILESKSQIKGHALASHLTRKCPHPYCGFEASTKADCEDHYLVYHDETAYKHFACQICGKPNVKAKVQHRYTHCNEEEKKELEATGKYSTIMKKICDECGQSFSNNKSLKSHRVKEHNYPESPKPEPPARPADVEEDQIHLCSLCGYIGKSENGLKRHYILHHPKPEDLRFVCIQCNQRFPKMSLLEKHKSVHTPFQCDQCSKPFKTKKALKIHLVAHTGVRPYQCDHCPITFLYKGHLQRHIANYHLEGSKPGRASYVKDPGRFGIRKTKPEDNKNLQSYPCDTPTASTSLMQKNEQESYQT